MTNKQTIDGVSQGEPALWVHPAYLVRREGMVPLAIDATLNQIAPAQIPLYAAQPQGEVESLRRLAEDSCNELIKRCLEHSDQLAERDALLREAWDVPAVHEHMPKAWHDRMIALATSTEPKPRGEPAAYRYKEPKQAYENEKPWELASVALGFVYLERKSLAEKGELVGKEREHYTGLTIEPLYADQHSHSGDSNEMVAKVVLPERMTLRSSDGTETYETKSWNACLDATAKLNGLKP